jgi:type I restriction enzyme S subunit
MSAGLRAGYKQTEVGVIPEEWDVTPLGCQVQITSGESPSLIQFTTSGKPYFKVEQLGNCEKYLGDESTPYHFRVGKTVRGNSVIFAKRGAAISLNRVRILSEDSFMDTNLMALTCLGDLDPEFLYYGLGYIGLWQFADVTSVPQINNKHVKPLCFPLPPLPEQRAIASALSDVDALLGGLDSLIAKKQGLKVAAMQQLLTGQTRLPGFSGEWEAVEFGDIATIRNTKVISSSTPAGTQCVELESIGQASGRLLGSFDASGPSSKYSFKRGDVLFGRLRAYLRKYWLAQFDGVCSTEIWPLIPRDERLYRGFLHLLVQTNGFVDAAAVSYGTHMPRSDWSVLGKFAVQLPPLPEQTAIAAVLSDMDTEIAALQARRSKTQALKQAMMQELLTGRIRLI